MADSKPTSVFLKLKDQGSIFHDPTQNRTIAGHEVKEFMLNPRVDRALKGGHVEKATEEEYNAWKKANKEAAAEAEKEAAKTATANTGVDVTEATGELNDEEEAGGAQQGGTKPKGKK